MSESKLSIPEGSLVLVTGATSFVASHIIKEFLERGYRVRATVRQTSNTSWIADEAFKSYADSSSFELVSVPDLSADHAFDSAVKGVSAIVHVATDSSFDSNPHKVIPQTVASTTSILHAALQESSVQQFVYTSSCAAAYLPSPDNKSHVERDTWNEEAVQLAWAPPPHGPEQGFIVYAASKVTAEKAVWKFVEEKKPHFSVNVVSPGTVLGEPLHKNYIRSTCSWATELYEGQPGKVIALPASKFPRRRATSYLASPRPVMLLWRFSNSMSIAFVVDVKDIALLHVATVLDSAINNARLQAWGSACNWNDLLAIMRNVRPQHRFIPDFPHARYLGGSTDTSESFALLKKWGNLDGWRPLKETIGDNLVFSRD